MSCVCLHTQHSKRKMLYFVYIRAQSLYLFIYFLMILMYFLVVSVIKYINILLIFQICVLILLVSYYKLLHLKWIISWERNFSTIVILFYHFASVEIIIHQSHVCQNISSHFYLWFLVIVPYTCYLKWLFVF